MTKIAYVFAFLGTLSAFAAPTPVPVTLLHTNDLHSHFRAERTPLGLGGVARLKTAVSQVRAQIPDALLVDGGDWSEGNIYYTEGAGRETLRMMDHIGYDVAIVGNHDWLNGPDVLLNVLNEAQPGLSLIATNISTQDYPRDAEFRRRIPPYVIKQVRGAKIAFIGLATYEFIYDSYFKPIKIREPFALTRELASRLKRSVDAVVVISHNSIAINKAILKAAPDVDLLVGAHDHVKLTQPVVVERRRAAPAWIVEAGSWGRYLGRVDFEVHPRDPNRSGSNPRVTLKNYSLRQMDASVAEDPQTLARIATLEALIESKKGPIFHDHVGDSEIELSRHGMENLMGDFATDSYRAVTGADLAIDHTAFIYNEIHAGANTTADLFNSNPGVYNPETGKTWSISTLPMKGRTLRWLLGLFFSSKKISQGAMVNFSGAELVFNPIIGTTAESNEEMHFPAPNLGILEVPLGDPQAQGISLKSLKIGGQEVQSDRTYKIAASGGVIETLKVIHTLLPGSLSLDRLQDTGIEAWRAMADSLRAQSPLTLDHIPYGRRAQTLASDLGLLYDDVTWEPLRVDAQKNVTAKIHVRIRNTGATPSVSGGTPGGPRVVLLLNENGVNYATDAQYRELGAEFPLPALQPGESTLVTWDQITLPRTLGVHAVTARVLGVDNEINHTNDEITRWFKPEQAWRRARPHQPQRPH